MTEASTARILAANSNRVSRAIDELAGIAEAGHAVLKHCPRDVRATKPAQARARAVQGLKAAVRAR
jgi:hypothetical protein